jgi:choline dehydrogenase-like flavoprotein
MVCPYESADPAAHPRYDPRYLSHPLDIELLARQLQFCEKIVTEKPLASILKNGGRRIPENADFTDLEATKKVTKERLFTAFHPVRTCAMMPKDIGGVIDSRLKIYETTNLRVVDTSIFPIEPLGHIQSTVYAVAEKAADIIKEDNRNPRLVKL